MDISVLKEILAGGLEKMHEAGVILVGGHSVEDNELKYGLSITGTIHPSKMVPNNGVRAGDQLILTKPLGNGIINTAVKRGMADEKVTKKATDSMAMLNRMASELMQETRVNACTDITGFGLLGHACEMIENTDVGLVIDSSAVPYFAEARELAEMGLVPGGLYRNRDFRSHMVDIGKQVPAHMVDILFDPQTSGGLLISVPSDHAQMLLKAMHKNGVSNTAIIGKVIKAPKGIIQVI
jgi:selenide,water dikinase